MKNVNDFLLETDAKKAKAKKKKTEEKPTLMTREEEFPDDKTYFVLMDQYKHLRRTDRERAQKILDKAQQLKKVSPQAKIGAAYL